VLIVEELLTSIENLIALKWLCLSGYSQLKELSTFVDQIECFSIFGFTMC
jgi:hypothetical protein